MHPLILIGVVFVAAVVWVSGILVALTRLAHIRRDNPDDAAHLNAETGDA